MVPVPVRIAAALVSLAALAGLVAAMALWTPPSLWTGMPRRAWWMGWWIGSALWAGACGARWAVLPAPGRARAGRGWGRHGAVWLVGLAMCAWAGHGAAVFWLKSDFWFVALKTHIWGLLAGLGVLLVVGGWRRRVGDRPHCRRCRYEKVEPCGALCPECGHGWSGPRGVVRGVPRWGPARLVAGIALLVAVYPAWRLVERIPGGRLAMDIAAQLPTDLLILLATPEGTEGRKDWHTWQVLLNRPMTPRQEAHLARRILASREWRGTLSNCAEPWILAAAAEGRLPGEIEEAYFAGIALPRLAASHWPDGPGAEVSIVGEYRPSFTRLPTADGQRFEARLYVSELRVSGAESGGGAVPVRQLFRLGDPSGPGGMLTGRLLPAGITPSVRFVPPAGGAATVTATLWLVYVSDPAVITPGSQAQAWNEDGSPRLPSEVLWSRKVELALAVERRRER